MDIHSNLHPLVSMWKIKMIHVFRLLMIILIFSHRSFGVVLGFLGSLPLTRALLLELCSVWVVPVSSPPRPGHPLRTGIGPRVRPIRKPDAFRGASANRPRSGQSPPAPHASISTASFPHSHLSLHVLFILYLTLSLFRAPADISLI